MPFSCVHGNGQLPPLRSQQAKNEQHSSPSEHKFRPPFQPVAFPVNVAHPATLASPAFLAPPARTGHREDPALLQTHLASRNEFLNRRHACHALRGREDRQVPFYESTD